MQVSILIPTFNRAPLLAQAIESALAQTHKQREIIVIDDGSTDNTPEVARRYPAVHYVRKENGGKSSAINLGIATSAGEVIVILDDDDLLPAAAISKHVEALKRDGRADFSYGRFGRFRGEKPPHVFDRADYEFVPVRDPRRLVVKLMENNFLPNPTFAVRRETQMRVGPYDESMFRSQDYDMILRLARSGQGTFVDDLVLYQRKHFSQRGPLADQVFVLDSVDKWIQYDAKLFERIEREWDICDFSPFSSAMTSDRDYAQAILQKGVILFQRKVYGGALRALEQYREHLEGRSPPREDLTIAAGLLGCRYGIDDLSARNDNTCKIIEFFRKQAWPASMRAAFGVQIRWRVRGAIKSGELGQALKLTRFATKAFGADAITAVMCSRRSFGLHDWRKE